MHEDDADAAVAEQPAVEADTVGRAELDALELRSLIAPATAASRARRISVAAARNLDGDSVETESFELGCELGISGIRALSHRIVQADERGEVLGMGQAACTGGSAEMMSNCAWNPAQHDVFVVSARGSRPVRKEDDVPVRPERGRNRKREQLVVSARFGPILFFGHAIAMIAHAIKMNEMIAPGRTKRQRPGSLKPPCLYVKMICPPAARS